ncbi:PKD domain-containing protein [Runella sp.]|uniref:PKD domain-containing protein n=1 Tax=Runella sp. TaxID=1960881 RepID=UPI003D0AE3D7
MKKLVLLLLLGFVILSCKEKIPVPVAKFAFSVQTKGEVIFTNQSTDANTYQWDFGDGSGKSSELNPKYVYQQPGRYTVTLKATGAGGEAQVQNTVEIVALKPTAAFSFTNLPNGEVQFLNESKDGVSYAWTFEGTGTSTLKDPKASFVYNGTYKVTLKVTGFGGVTEELTKTVTITNGKERPPVIDVTVKDAGQGKVQFTNNTQNGVSYSWTFGDGGTSTEANPTYTYLFNGTYKITLCATNKSGETVCKDFTSTVTGIAPIKIFDEGVFAASYTVENNNLIIYMPENQQYVPTFLIDVNQNAKVDANLDRGYGADRVLNPNGTPQSWLCYFYLLSGTANTFCGEAKSSASLSIDANKYRFMIPLSELDEKNSQKNVLLNFRIYDSKAKNYYFFPGFGKAFNDFEKTYSIKVKR